MSNTAFSDLTGLDLAAVTFVRSYVQLDFNGPVLSAITMPVVVLEGRTMRSDAPGYRDALCECIGKVVRGAAVESGERILIDFVDGTEIYVSLKFNDHVAVEAATYEDSEGHLWVW